MSSSAAFRRNPLIINGNSLSSGERSATFAAENPRALLQSYLIFVRDMRGLRREPSIELRTDDITVLSHHLGVTEEFVVGGLLDLMGATRAQRSTMLAMLAAGALTVVLSGSIVSALSTDGISVDMTRLADAVQAAATGSGAEASSSDTADGTAAAADTFAASSTAAADSPAMHRTAIESAGTAAATPSIAEPLLTELTSATPAPDVLHSASAAAVAALAANQPTAESTGGETNAEQVGSIAQEPVSIGIAPDGSVVASVAPPVPDTTPDEPVATAELPDGTVVGVAAPPLPPSPAEPVATAELPDGTVVGVAAPPVPPVPPAAND